MNLIKFLNLVMLAFILALVVNIVSPKPSSIPQNAVSLIATNSDIPNIPQLTLHNTTANTIEVDTCRDISLSQNSRTVDIQEIANTIAPDFCQKYSVAAGTNQKISLEPLYRLFQSQPASYVLTLNANNEQLTSAFSVSATGFFKKFLTELIYNPIYNLFAVLIAVFQNSLGWAIVAITVLIRLILLFPQNKMLENNRKMTLLNPKIRALQKQYKDDKATQGMKLMELYKEENINPMGSCLPMLIQFPILLALYWVIMGITQIANIYHLYPFISFFNPRHIETAFFGHNLLQIGGVTGMVVAVILAFTQWVQAYIAVKAQPTLPAKKSQKTDDADAPAPALDPQAMQKMTLYIFPLMIGISALFFPIGLGLYWWIGLLFMIVQQYFVNKRGTKLKTKGELLPARKNK